MLQYFNYLYCMKEKKAGLFEDKTLLYTSMKRYKLYCRFTYFHTEVLWFTNIVCSSVISTFFSFYTCIYYIKYIKLYLTIFQIRDHFGIINTGICFITTIIMTHNQLTFNKYKLLLSDIILTHYQNKMLYNIQF